MKRYENILVPIDFSTCSQVALAEAVRLADADTTIHVLHVMSPASDDAWSPLRYTPEEVVLGRERKEILRETIRAVIEQHGRSPAADAAPRFETAVRRGAASARIILDVAADRDADLIVMGTHAWRGLHRMLLGSVAEEVIRLAACPVLVVKETEPAAERPAGASTGASVATEEAS